MPGFETLSPQLMITSNPVKAIWLDFLAEMGYQQNFVQIFISNFIETDKYMYLLSSPVKYRIYPLMGPYKDMLVISYRRFGTTYQFKYEESFCTALLLGTGSIKVYRNFGFKLRIYSA